MLRNKCYSSYCLLNSFFHHNGSWGFDNISRRSGDMVSTSIRVVVVVIAVVAAETAKPAPMLILTSSRITAGTAFPQANVTIAWPWKRVVLWSGVSGVSPMGQAFHMLYWPPSTFRNSLIIFFILYSHIHTSRVYEFPTTYVLQQKRNDQLSLRDDARTWKPLLYFPFLLSVFRRRDTVQQRQTDKLTSKIIKEGRYFARIFNHPPATTQRLLTRLSLIKDGARSRNELSLLRWIPCCFLEGTKVHPLFYFVVPNAVGNGKYKNGQKWEVHPFFYFVDKKEQKWEIQQRLFDKKCCFFRLVLILLRNRKKNAQAQTRFGKKGEIVKNTY